MTYKPCKFCNADISIVKEGDKWVPRNPDGSRHDCRSQKVDKPVAQLGPSNPLPDLENYIRRIAREEAERVLKENVG